MDSIQIAITYLVDAGGVVALDLIISKGKVGLAIRAHLKEYSYVH